MKFKVGDQWFECGPGTPLMVVLSEEDKRNLANMAPDATKYAVFADGESMTTEAKRQWMDAVPKARATGGIE